MRQVGEHRGPHCTSPFCNTSTFSGACAPSGHTGKQTFARSRLIMWAVGYVVCHGLQPYIMALLPTQPLFSTGSGGLGLDNTRGWGLAAGAWGAGAWGAQRCTVHSVFHITTLHQADTKGCNGDSAERSSWSWSVSPSIARLPPHSRTPRPGAQAARGRRPAAAPSLNRLKAGEEEGTIQISMIFSNQIPSSHEGMRRGSN